jgi:hypothetical protein
VTQVKKYLHAVRWLLGTYNHKRSINIIIILNDFESIQVKIKTLLRLLWKANWRTEKLHERKEWFLVTECVFKSLGHGFTQKIASLSRYTHKKARIKSSLTIQDAKVKKKRLEERKKKNIVLILYLFAPPGFRNFFIHKFDEKTSRFYL